MYDRAREQRGDVRKGKETSVGAKPETELERTKFVVIQEPILLARYFNKSLLFLSTLIMLTILSPLV